MFHSPRKSLSLQHFQSLEGRTTFTKEQSSTFHRLTNGYNGEMKWAHLVQDKLFSLFDLHLQSGESEFQLDHLLLSEQSLYLFEVKNFEGDYVLNDEQWYLSVSKREIRNPLHQLSRSHLLLKQFLKQENIQVNIRPYLIFINPNFHLYHAPENTPIIFPGQIQRFSRQLNLLPSPSATFHQQFKSKLFRSHLAKSNYEQLPEYDYKQLKKGVLCHGCRRWMKAISSKRFFCSICNKSYSNTEVILNNIRELLLLFPEKKLQVNLVYDWCGGLVSKRVLQRVMLDYLTLVPKGRLSFYIPK